MKRFIIGLGAIAIFITLGTACTNQVTIDTSSPPPPTGIPIPEAKSNTPVLPTNPTPNSQSNVVVNVDDLMTSPDRYVGRIKVEGVVSSVSLAQQSIGLIDSREFAACGETTCWLFMLPIQWSGTMPQIEDTVQVVGEVQESNEKLIFVAQSLENVKQPEGILK